MTLFNKYVIVFVMNEKFEKIPKNNLDKKREKGGVEPIIEKKKERLEQIKENVNKITDALGHSIDEYIKEPVIYLNALGIFTTQSCEGHINEGLPHPFIDVGAFGEPKRFNNQEEILEQIARKYNLKPEEIEKKGPGCNGERNIFNDAYSEAWSRWEECGETQEWIEWNKKDKRIQKKAQKILEEFYKDRKVDDFVKLKLEGFRIHNGNGWGFFDENLSEEEKQNQLKITRKEMDAFTKFLKQKWNNYLNE